MSAPITQFVIKVHSRCDLACDHCYVYEHADQSWLTKPRAIATETIERAADRIAEHAAAHLLGDVHVVLHGGEPLLLGADGLRTVLGALRSRIIGTRLDLRVHTNGVLLDERLCDLFDEYDVHVGVSLDGDPVAHDRHRRFADGRGSHAHVRRALALLRRPEYRRLYAGILCTIDLSNDPIAVYEALLAEAPPRMDLLLPHATWDSPPSRPAGDPAPYAAWLQRIYARWTADGRPVPIRLFDSLLSAARGGPSFSETVGLDPADLLVIETDGGWEQADSLKTAYDGAPATGMDVFSHSVDEVAKHPGVAARMDGLPALCAVCRACPVVGVCGGGLYAHRYRSGSGFDNPSVYCADLKSLITGLTARPGRTTAAGPAEPAPVAAHVLPADAFDSLAAGAGSVPAVASLAAVRSSVTRALVAKVGSGSGSGHLGRVAAEGWALLSHLDATRPEAVRDVLAHPYVEAWAVRCLQPPADADEALDRAHVAGLAAAAALRAGERAELELPVRERALHLPSIGALTLGPAAAPSVRVSLSPAGLVTGEDAGWWTVRRCGADGGSIAVDDVDPFRDCQRWPAAGRLSDASWRSWRQGLAAALRILRRELPAYADVLGAGLRTVVPLRVDPAGRLRSGTARHAFGAVAVAYPPDPSALAALLVHEFQHVKLNAMLDLYDFHQPADRRRFRVPWRPDPRPIEGVLHGVYAHLALAELWRARMRHATHSQAGLLFRRYRSWVREVTDTLTDKGALTGDGYRLLTGMRTAVEGWSDAG